MTKKTNETNDQRTTSADGLKPRVGLVKHAYTGAPKGTAHVDLSNPELRSPKPRWELKTKKQRRQDIIDNL